MASKQNAFSFCHSSLVAFFIIQQRLPINSGCRGVASKPPDCLGLQYQLICNMEPEEKIKYSSKFSVESKRSNVSSCRSLQRQSWSSRDHSLNKNRSLIEVMSLQGSKKSDIYEKILAEDVHLPSEKYVQKPSGSGFNPFKTCFKVGKEQEKRLSYEQGQDIGHICLCYLSCKRLECPCYSTPEQDCVINFCCKECIQKKKKMREVSEEQNQIEVKVSCTCKKTKCNKKYCTCFAAGLKCGRDCSCEDCINCDRPISMEIEPVCIVDEEIVKMEMPESMDFEPFEFQYSNNA